VLGPQSLAAAAALKQREGGTLGEALVRLGLIDEARLVSVFQQSLFVPVVTPQTLKDVQRSVTRIVPGDLAALHRSVPVEIDEEGNLILAMADPTDNHAVDELSAYTGRFVIRAVAAPSAIRDALFAHYGVTLIKTPSPKPEKPTSGQAPEKERRQVEPPAAQGQGPVLSALVRAVTGQPGAPAPGNLEPAAPAQGLARPSKPVKPNKLAGAVPARVPGGGDGPILLDRLRGGGSGKAPAASTLPGLGTPAEELLAPVARLRAAQSRDEVVEILLDYANLLAARVGLFVVQKGQLSCLDGRGPDHVVLAMKWFTISVDEASPFRDVLMSRAPYIGTLEDTPNSRSFRNALGTSSKDLLLLPLIVGDRAVGVLYADEIHADLGKLSVELEILSREAGAAFARIILAKKSTPQKK
jgi:hypothetical protein